MKTIFTVVFTLLIAGCGVGSNPPDGDVQSGKALCKTEAGCPNQNK